MIKTLKKPLPWLCLLLGFSGGLAVSWLWPAHPSFAFTTDRSEKFALTTVRLDASTDAVFVLDFLTGRLQGAVYSRQANGFVAYYFRNVSRDFHLSGNIRPQFAIVGALGAPQSRGPAQLGASMIYVAELTTGRVNAYAIPYQVWNRPVPPMQLVPAGSFSFRERL